MTANKLVLPAAVGVIAAGMIGIFIIGNSGGDKAATETPAGEIVSESGVHWHPELVIYVKGVQIPIPPNVGIESEPHKEVHTHTDLPKLHWEIATGPVTKQQARLGAFFESWEKPFSSTQLMVYTNGPDGTVKMTVNGRPNSEFDSYIVKDGDKIELRYE